jgi:hypothetical protein
VTWSAIIQQAATTRFAKTGSCDPFLLAKRDLEALCEELTGIKLKTGGVDYVRVQARVYVAELRMQLLVDEWTQEAELAKKQPGVEKHE